MKIFWVSILISLSATPLPEPSARSYFIVWNVGQGLWTTRVTATECQHFDVGGEFLPLKRMKQVCQGKRHLIFLSHWDWDHIGGLKWLKGCLAARPLGRSSATKEKLINSLPSCDLPTAIKRWTPQLRQKARVNTNEYSQIFTVSDILLPGDSTDQMEQIWSRHLDLKEIQILLLGHHGSRTSTSSELLRRLPSLRYAVSSARWRRFRHPHPQIVEKVHKKGVSLLKTEDLGNIWFEL